MPTPRIDSILEKHGFKRSPQTTWSVQGNPVIFHHILELIAIDLEIEWMPPVLVRAGADECVVLVGGNMDGKFQWTFGEARIEANYRVSGKQAAYVYAMAEKRGKDRLIYKFLGLADATEPEEVTEKTEKPAEQNEMTTADKLRHNLGRKATLQELNDYVEQIPVRNAIGGLGPEELASIADFIQERRRALSGGATSRDNPGLWSGQLDKAKTALAKAKNVQEVNSYESMMMEQEFNDAPGEIIEAFHDLCESRRYGLK